MRILRREADFKDLSRHKSGEELRKYAEDHGKERTLRIHGDGKERAETPGAAQERAAQSQAGSWGDELRLPAHKGGTEAPKEDAGSSYEAAPEYDFDSTHGGIYRIDPDLLALKRRISGSSD